MAVSAGVFVEGAQLSFLQLFLVDVFTHLEFFLQAWQGGVWLVFGTQGINPKKATK